MTFTQLAQSTTHGAGAIFFRAVLLLLALIAAWVGSLVVARYVRRQYMDDDEPEPFTLQHLRELRDQGQISAAEFEHLRAGLLGRMADKQGDATRDGETRARPRDEDGHR